MKFLKFSYSAFDDPGSKASLHIKLSRRLYYKKQTKNKKTHRIAVPSQIHVIRTPRADNTQGWNIFMSRVKQLTISPGLYHSTHWENKNPLSEATL